MATKFAIIYSQKTGRIRRIKHPDFDRELDAIPLLPGEAFMIRDRSEYKAFIVDGVTLPALDCLQDLVTKETGLEPKDDRYVIVDDSGKVVGVTPADLTCGDAEAVVGFELIKEPLADIGWEKNPDGTFEDKRPATAWPPEKVGP